ncbi:NAD-dependent epimerase/dehydratase family protein [Mesorhizobium captivum]|uniref:NAD-dependent epimerase/dehydratase family protein n=1 Tax=Mesorhizobium captivum TaxID=3072319 RepID=A0ABU4YX67_9HYPH|nr:MULTISPECIES: NAD-dependent epimerase/dehydratase family protein [unclassified Mesorhizobium]MDX8446008.1 NAD-dependent epimerase/dehydratase family protein [Mesorhizobium sp. VK3C]MDX8491565.1 NAD-dependent epimerase/dehydratase family protein [Mesorhizobium sp. VK22B]MDX8505192.1 NAD-dependent epimerase/dehydratase family protein [Mesorhizobium sp. VK22E]
MKILVTGAGGFLGQRLVSVLRAQGHDVWGVTRRSRAAQSDYDLVLDDPLEPERYANIVGQNGIETTINALAAGVDPRERDIGLLVRVNSVFPALLAAAVASAGATNFIQIGSSAEYAPLQGKGYIPEEAPLTQDKLYGGTKAAGSVLLRTVAAEVGLRACVLRLFNIYGPGEKAHRLFPSLLGRLSRGERVPLSAGSQVRDFLYVDDACLAIARMIRALPENPPVAGVYNLASGRAVSVREFAVAIADAIGADRQLLAFGELAMRPDDLPYIVADTRRLDDLIGPAASITIAMAVRSILGQPGGAG